MRSHLLEKGLVTVYTGAGRGKTTAALGLALRVLGWGGRVCMIQFIKGYSEIGEVRFADQYGDRFEIRQFAIDLSPSIRQADVLQRREAAELALSYAETAISGGDYDLVILDEINNALHYDLISTQAVLAIVKGRPAHVELVLTGRDAPPEIIEAADYVTEMLHTKHPFQKGIPARRGVDY
jgi:cob(I)alamin adenosyltransferase